MEFKPEPYLFLIRFVCSLSEDLIFITITILSDHIFDLYLNFNSKINCILILYTYLGIY